MPKELKKRGRREDKKRKRQEETSYDESKEQLNPQILGQDFIPLDDTDTGTFQGQDVECRNEGLPFYGLLDEQEQEYFKRADSLLEMNTFVGSEERDLFLANVFKEANGKELKIANSQSCSRLMERLILLSNPDQLKAVFQKFDGQFLNLVQHRFASHCCEALFLQAATVCAAELKAATVTHELSEHRSMEGFIVSVVNELEPQFGYLLSDVFASHPLRVLLAVLSGMPLAASSTTSTLRSRKKENVSVTLIAPSQGIDLAPRTVSSAFQAALHRMIAGILAGLDTTSVRALATQPVANPVLQMILQIELTESGKQSAKDTNSLLRRLLPDEHFDEGTESAAFVQHLLFDSVGSRLLEVTVSYAPGKTFKALYRNVLKSQLANAAKNDIAAFVIIKLLERLGKDDLQTAMEQICSCIDVLIQRSQTAIIKIMIERSRAREVDTEPIAVALAQCDGDKIPRSLLDMLQGTFKASESMSTERKKQAESQDVGKVHASLLMQTMLHAPGPLRELVNNALLTLDISELMNIAQDRSASRVVQIALTCKEQSIGFRRLFLQRFTGTITNLASDPIASHVIDALWTGSLDLMFLRERIASEMASNESVLRESLSGRAVWRNWKMDLHKTRRNEWRHEGKGETKVTKSAIELARERHASKPAKRQHIQDSKLKTGPNAIVQGAA